MSDGHRIEWPADHPNTKILMLTGSSRLALAKAPKSPETDAALANIDRIEQLLGEMRVGTPRITIDDLVHRVSGLVDELVGQMMRFHGR